MEKLSAVSSDNSPEKNAPGGHEDSLKRRYFFKIITNIVGLGVGVVTQSIIPRGLGPKAYGDFSFLSNFFFQLVGFLDMSTSMGFYTKLCQRPREYTLTSFYLYFVGIMSLVLVGFVVTTLRSDAYHRLWPDQTNWFIYLAAGWGILTWVVQVFTKMVDAYGLTVSGELANILQKIFGLVLVTLLFIFNYLNLTNFFFCQYVLFIFLCVSLGWIFRQKGYSLAQGWRLSRRQITGYLKEFYRYSHPLFSYGLVGMVVGIFDRWLLQFYGGSVQQGFWGLSYQIGTICLLFASGMTSLLTREFAIAFANRDLNYIAILFRRYIPIFYSVTAFISCFIAVQADKVIYIIGGKSYSAAIVPVIIMAFYPIAQTYGNLSGSLFYATGKTALYRNIGIIFMVIGLPITYFLIAPVSKFGLDIGATGLAIKVVVLAFIAVNVQLYFSARLLKLRFWRYLGHQLLSGGCMLVSAVAVRLVLEMSPLLRDHVIASFLLAGFLYTIIVIGVTFIQPLLFGLQRQDIYDFGHQLSGLLIHTQKRS
jgi:O-antigen/teichoic acid export membrane protein